MNIKICGLFRDKDIEYINEARPDYAGFVFAESRRQVSPKQAEHLRSRLAAGIIPVGVFVNAPITEIAALYRSGVIEIAQLHGDEDEAYIARLKSKTKDQRTKSKEKGEMPIIKVIRVDNVRDGSCGLWLKNTDYLLFDNGAGSGKPFDWNVLAALFPPVPSPQSPVPINWFLAGGINLDNIEQAMGFNPYAIDVSSGAETDGVKDREKILQLTAKVRGYTL